MQENMVVNNSAAGPYRAIFIAAAECDVIILCLTSYVKSKY
jgi:hypothetical protein